VIKLEKREYASNAQTWPLTQVKIGLFKLYEEKELIA